VGRVRDDAKELFRRAVLDAAEEVFAEHGYHRARIQDIAKRARVGVGTIYNHFAQKEDVLAALLVERGDEIHAELERRPSDPDEFEPQFRARFGRVVSFLARHNQFFRLAASVGLLGEEPAVNAPIVDIHREQEARMRATVDAMLADGIAQKALAPHPVASLARFLRGAMKQVLLGTAQDGGDLEKEAAWALELFLRGARVQIRATCSSGSRSNSPSGR
jgi:AcrR family transcriptional regulator